jgi:hypothetical protein
MYQMSWWLIIFSMYDQYKAGLFYMSKDGLSGEDWDFISNSTNTAEDEN